MSDHEFNKLFARNLTYFMNLNKKNQTNLSKDLQISKATISSWCNGTRIPRMDKIDILCNYFNIQRSDLMEDNINKQEQNYYFNEDIRKMAQCLIENPDYQNLFNIIKKSSQEDIEFVTQMAKRLANNENTK